MEKVSQEFLAELAKSNSQVLNDKPLREEDYDIQFEYDGANFSFSQKKGYWKWNWQVK